MLSVIVLNSHFIYYYVEYHFAECRYAECCSTLFGIIYTRISFNLGQILPLNTSSDINYAIKMSGWASTQLCTSAIKTTVW